MAGAVISSVQKGGIASSLKHFVANDMEHERTLVDCRISQRALREIYLLPFQLAIRDANPWALMTAYNRVNGTHMCENAEILQDIVRREWNYDGCILSDWFGTYSTVEAINAGLDLEMPGPTEWRGKKVSTAMSVGKISNDTINQRASSVLKLIERCSKSGIPESGPEICLDSESGRDVLRRLGSESIVLLKNERNILPLDSAKSVSLQGLNSFSLDVNKYAAGSHWAQPEETLLLRRRISITPPLPLSIHPRGTKRPIREASSIC